MPKLHTLSYPAPGVNASLSWREQLNESICGQEQMHQAVQPISRVATVVSGGSNFEAAEHQPGVNNHRCYCARNALRYHHVQHDFLNGSGVHRMFNKMWAVMHALEATQMGEWVFWVDRDVVFTNMSAPPREYVERAMATHPTPADCQLVMAPSLEAGVVLFRKTCWTMALLNDWWQRRFQCVKPPQFDQIPLILTLLNKFDFDHTVLNASSPLIRHRGDHGQSLANPFCSTWGHQKDVQYKWGTRARAWLLNASTRPASPLCVLPENWESKAFGRPLHHFAGSAQHAPIKKCWKLAEAPWRHAVNEEAAAKFCSRHSSHDVPACAVVAPARVQPPPPPLAPPPSSPPKLRSSKVVRIDGHMQQAQGHKHT